MFFQKMKLKIENLLIASEDFKITRFLVIVSLLLLLFMVIFIVPSSLKVGGLKQLFYLFISCVAVCGDSYLWEAHTHYDPSTKPFKTYRAAWFILTVCIFGVLMYQGYVAQSLYK